MAKDECARQNVFSHQLEKAYYSRRWPDEALPYLHLESYLRCWLDAEAIFGGKRVLDIGAGECTYSRLIAERFGVKKIVACELFRERMLPAVHANQSPDLNFVAGDAFKLPFESDSFNVIFGTFILHQLPDLEQVICEIRRVCSRGGCYVGIEPNPYHPVHLYRYVRGVHSPNQYLLGPRHLAAFEEAGFGVRIRYFYAKLPLIRNRLLGTCMGIMANLRDGQK